MRFISGRCSVHFRCIRSVSVCRTVSSVSMRFSSVGISTRPLHLRFVRPTSGSCPIMTRVYRTSTETQRTATEDATDEYRTERTPNVHVTDALVCSVRRKVLNMLKNCHRTERTPTDITGQVTYSPDE